MAGSRAPGLRSHTAKAAPRVRVLVVEDDQALRDSLLATLRARGFSAVGAASVPEALWALSKTPIDVTLSDLRINGPGGRDLVRRLRAGAPDTPHVILTARENLGAAVACVREGASDFVLKPPDAPSLEVALQRALEARAMRRELRYLRHAAREDAVSSGAGDGEDWRRALSAIDAAAGTERPVLLCGEWVAGQRHLAFRLHERSARATGPLVRVSGATLRAGAWQSEIFGHRQGAFEGADTDHEGSLQLAHGGTVVFEDVAALSPLARAKLRRLLEEGVFDRPGEVQPTPANVRVVLAARSDVAGFPDVIRIDVPDAPAPVPARVAPVPATVAPPVEEGQASLNLRESLHRAERHLLVEALKRAGGVQREAARLLGIDARNLPYFLRKYDLLERAEDS